MPLGLPFRRTRVEDAPVVDHDADPRPAAEAGDKEAGVTSEPHATESDSDTVSTDAQIGVQKIEATTKVWPTSHLIMAYMGIWIIYFVDALNQGSTSLLSPYVASSFGEHSLTPTVSIMSSLIGGIFRLPLAKILDIWGRPQGFLLMMMLMTIGLIMMAACQNIETYAAAQVFYWVGYTGIGYTMSVFIADTSALKNRALMFAFSQSPFIITTWITGFIATDFLEGAGLKWAFGTFAIVTPIMCLPLFFLFTWNYRKARRMGLMPVRSSGRTWTQSVWYYVVQFDLLGMLLLTAGFALFLLPFSIYTYQAEQWRAPIIICFIIFGALLLVAFAVYERWFAPVQFMPFHLIKDRTVAGACVLAGTLFVSFYLWDNYFTSFLQVVNGLSLVHTNYVANIYSVGSCLWAILVGVAVRWSGRFKWLALYFGIPLTILGVGLMINFRQPEVEIGYVVMCQIFIAFAGGALVITEQMAAMAAVGHQHVAVVLAVENMFASVGGAVGSTVATAIWTAVFPNRLARYLPAGEQASAAAIYGDLTVQLGYPKGTAARDAIERAYGDAQRIMLISATVVHVISLAAVLVWRDIKVKDFKQVKGNVI